MHILSEFYLFNYKISQEKKYPSLVYLKNILSNNINLYEVKVNIYLNLQNNEVTELIQWLK